MAIAAGNLLGADISGAKGKAGATVTMEGLTAIVTAIIGFGPQAVWLMASSMKAEMQAVVTDAKDNYVPIDTGRLQRSAFVRQTDSLTVEGGFGGRDVVNASGSPYAVAVHEIPPDSGGRWGTGAKHAQGKQWKYLQVPFMLAADGMASRIASKVLAGLVANATITGFKIT